jgi:hypothetical protein
MSPLRRLALGLSVLALLAGLATASYAAGQQHSPGPSTPTDTTTAPPPTTPPTTTPEPEPAPVPVPVPEPVPDEEEVPDEEWQAPDDGEVITARVGARCVDGNLSTATGSGACSHHGGVAAWLISDCTVDDFADHPDEAWISEHCYLEWEPAA